MSKKIADKDIWIRTFEVSQPKKHKKGFTVYKVVSTVFPKSFPEGATKIKVWKRYNEFKKLHKELELVFRQLYLKGEFPKFPKDQVFGRFDEELIEERRKCALKLLEFAASYSLLFTNKIFVKFFESSYNLQDCLEENHSVTEENSSSTRSIDNSHQCGPCLIPESVWKECPPKDEAENENDHHSLSSFTCSSPEPVALNNDADSILSSCLISSRCETLVQDEVSEIPSTSGQPKVTTFTDSNHSAKPSYTNPEASVPSPYLLASFTDDFDVMLDSDPDTEYSPGNRLSNSVSCLSLDTMPYKKSLREPKDVGENRHSNNTAKKGLNGFSFFDFLPIFAKKQASTVENEKVLADSLSASYICEAAGHFTVANLYESNSEYDSAFEAYKEGIQILLTGAQNDNDPKRRVMVRKKIENYLSKAETLKEKTQHESPSYLSENTFEQTMSSARLSTPRKKLQDLVDRDSSFDDGFVVVDRNIMPSSVDELRVYKVVGCTYNNLLVVVDTSAVGGPKCYAVKVFRKSACTMDPEKPTLIPFTVPFMVRMIKWFNTEDSIILILQYAGGGRLINFVKAYQTKHISPVIHDASPGYDEHDECLTFDSDFAVSSDYSRNSIKLLTMTDSIGSANPIENLSSIKADRESGKSGTNIMPLEIENKQKLGSEKGNKRSSQIEVEVKKNEKKDCWSSSVCVPVDLSGIGMDTGNSSYCSLNSVISNDRKDPADPNFLNEVVEERGQPISSIFNLPEESILFSGKISSQNLETEELIENSKVLIQTVSRTLGLLEAEINDKPQEEKEVFQSKTIASLQNMSVLNVPLKIPKKNGIYPEISENRIAKPSNLRLVPSFSGNIEDCVYNVPKFSSFSNYSDTNESFDEEISQFKRMVPECCTKVWAAEIVIALEKLHNQGITYGDLDVNNILLGESGHILLSYRALWNEVDKLPAWNKFSAPEVCMSLGKSLWRVHPSADWWSLGAIIFLLITGQTVQDVHPEGMYPQTVINIPQTNFCGELITPSARMLLAELLQYSATVRLGYYGAEEIKSHPFFEGFDWDGALKTISEDKSMT